MTFKLIVKNNFIIFVVKHDVNLFLLFIPKMFILYILRFGHTIFTYAQHCSNSSDKSNSQSTISKSSESSVTIAENKFIEVNDAAARRHERSLRNTFGWTRIDILTMLIVGIFLTAFCFSLLIEAVQTLVHIDHQDTMHHPGAVFSLGAVGLILNGVCFLLIGGYTHHQGSFLHITSSGDVILDRTVTGDALRRGGRRLSKTKRDQSNSSTQSTPSINKADDINVTITTPQKCTEQKRQPQLQRKHTLNEIMRDNCSKLIKRIFSHAMCYERFLFL